MQAAYIAHQYKDRTRLRVPARRGNQAYFAQVEQRLSEHDHVMYVETNPLTGSILVYHTVSLDDLLQYAAQRQLFALPDRTATEGPVLDQASRQFDLLDRYIQQKTHGTLDLEGAVFSGLVLAAIIQMLRGQVVGPTSALLSYAAAILVGYRSWRRAEERQRSLVERNGHSE